MIQGTLAVLEGTLAVIQGTLAMIQGTLAVLQGTLAVIQRTLVLWPRGTSSPCRSTWRLSPLTTHPGVILFFVLHTLSMHIPKP